MRVSSFFIILLFVVGCGGGGGNEAPGDQQQPTTNDQQQPTTNDQQQPTTNDQQQPTTNDQQQPTTNDQQQPTTNDQQQPTTNDQQQPTTNDQQQPTTNDQQQPTTNDQQQPTTRTAMGQFKDSNVAGLSYISGGQSGVTDSEGRFTYEIGETVIFSVGSVTLGETEGKSVVTPVDLVEEGSSSSKPVVNMVRLLTSLDQDAELSNGITISQDVQTRAEDWTLEINSEDFDQQLENIRPDLQEVYENFSGFSDEATARDHLETTLRCSYSGAYSGTYWGADQGNFGFIVDSLSGDVSGIAYSTEYGDSFIVLTGTRAISYDQNAAFASGSTDLGTEFNGQFTSVDTVEGQWVGGDFSGRRIGGDQYAVYRATGNYEYGVFTFDVNDSGRVTGFVYNITVGAPVGVSGSLSGTALSATANDGTIITGTLDRETGDLRGSYYHPSAEFSGTFQGNGCQLN